jgi:predicted small secreted protein
VPPGNVPRKGALAVHPPRETNVKQILSTTLFALLLAVAGCANTIQGAGQDTAAAVDATQSATANVVDAVD